MNIYLDKFNLSNTLWYTKVYTIKFIYWLDQSSMIKTVVNSSNYVEKRVTLELLEDQL